jgi:hypothetical protein
MMAVRVEYGDEMTRDAMSDGQAQFVERLKIVAQGYGGHLEVQMYEGLMDVLLVAGPKWDNERTMWTVGEDGRGRIH